MQLLDDASDIVGSCQAVPSREATLPRQAFAPAQLLGALLK